METTKGQKKPRNIPNIVINHRSTVQRTGRNLRRAYYQRRGTLLKGAKDLEIMTGRIVNLETMPTWEKCVKKLYCLERHEPHFNA